MTAEHSTHLLDILQAHGQQFLDSFEIPAGTLASRKRSHDEYSQMSSQGNGDSEEEWGGIVEDDDARSQDQSLSESGDDDFEQAEDDFTAESSTTTPNVVVFRDTFRPSKTMTLNSKAQKKAFMSHKIAKLRQDSVRELEKSEKDEEDERTNAQNDATLHRLIHTKLLSGSLNTELELTPAQRRKALAGSIVELSGEAKLGRGEKSVRDKERNRASKRVREGLLQKQKERREQELAEAKDVGNYHPTLKQLFEPAEGEHRKKRERGLRMGVGKFRGGFLTLSREDIVRAQGGGSIRGRGTARSRGGPGYNRGRHRSR